ncbi:THAP domain-containing protein [Plakobranchus ocellatus]|uniref:THAP domain-containing protein n=1 Tax=Plakobranchus ocellatus TaxID=259542 RepID=A0AAV4B378_9GAST|nr:THAP domain-containing protein [Plakobranchus ocellatus]
MTSNEKLCTFVFDEMSIKEAACYDPKHDLVQGFEDYAHLGRSRYKANHACVFMARGLTANWKQPFGSVFSSVICGKGGHRNNPDIGQFTSALQQVMVDSLMVASTRLLNVGIAHGQTLPIWLPWVKAAYDAMLPNYKYSCLAKQNSTNSIEKKQNS